MGPAVKGSRGAELVDGLVNCPAVKVKGSRLQLVNFLHFCTANIVDVKDFGIATPTLQEWPERVADA